MLKQRLCVVLAITALLFLGSVAWAGTVSGTVYRVTGNYLDAANYLVGPGVTLEGTFTAPGINFSITDGQQSSDPLLDFLTSGGAIYGSMSGLNEVMSNCTNNVYTPDSGCYSTAITIKAFGYFVNGMTYTVTHDDGVIVDIGNTSYLNLPSPVGPTPSSFTFTGSTGEYSYTVYYMATNGNPEILQSNTPTPEPSSLLLLGSGMAVMIAGVRRKLRR